MNRLFIFICLTFIFSTCAMANTYTVGVQTLNFQPYFGYDKQGHYRGFARELMDQFADYAGIAIIYKPMRPSDLMPALAAGEIDFKFPENPEWKAPASIAGRVSYSGPAVEYVAGALVSPKRKGRGIDQIKRMAIVEGWTPLGFKDEVNDYGIELIESETLPKMIRQVLLRDSDAAYYNVVVAVHYINQSYRGTNVLVFDPSLPYQRSTYHLAAVEYPELIQRFDDFLEERSADVEALKKKYQIATDVESEYFGLEQWKIDFLKRQKNNHKDHGQAQPD